jgi:hypothetical protein
VVDKNSELHEIVESLRRQRVRQGDLKPLLEFLIAQAEAVLRLGATASQAASEIKSRALELHRAGSYIPKFVVEDLLEESITRLERAQQP